MSKNPQRILLVTALVLVLAIAGVLVYEYAFARFGKKRELPPLYGWALSSEDYDPDRLSPGILKIVDRKLTTAYAIDSQTSARLIASLYETPARRGEEGMKSDLFRASDQLAYGRSLARLGKRSQFLRWMDSFDAAYRGESGLHADLPGGEGHWSVSLAYARALLEGYKAFGGSKIEKKITGLSAFLLPLFLEEKTADDLIAGPRTLVAYDEWDTPPPDTLPLPGEDRPLVQDRGTYLADINLWALFAFSRFDPDWGPVASRWQKILEESRLEAGLPLYASAVSEDGSYYLPVTGQSLVSGTREQLTIALHLAEVGSDASDLASLIRSRLRDYKQLPAGWNPVTASPVSAVAQPADYALALSLGRALADDLLISSAREVMMFSYASSQSSDIFGGWYRPVETDRTYLLTAEDNMAVLIALR